MMVIIIVNYYKSKLGIGEVGHQLGLVKFCEWIGRTCHDDIAVIMKIIMMLMGVFFLFFCVPADW